MRISAVIPSYNAAHLLPRALESVFRQSMPCEAVVVDDGSTDHTSEVIRDFRSRFGEAHDRLHHVRQDNAGPSVARNRGAELARGDWVAFLDADDYWYRDKLRTQWRATRTYPGAAAYFSGVDVEDINGARYRRLPPYSGLITWSQMLLENLVPSPTPLIRKEVFQTVGGFDESRRFAEDWDLWLRVTEFAPIVAQQEALACYWDNDTGLHRDPRKFEGAWSVLANSLARMYRKGLQPGLADRAFACLHLREAYDNMLNGRHAEAIRMAGTSLRYDWRRIPVAGRIGVKSTLGAIRTL